MTRRGHSQSTSDPEMVEALRTLLEGQRTPLPDLCRRLGVSENWLKELWRGEEVVPPHVAVRAANLLEERAEHLSRMSQRFRRAARPPRRGEALDENRGGGRPPTRWSQERLTGNDD